MPIHNDISYLGKIFFLDVCFEHILERLSIDEKAKRPLFTNEGEARRLYNERKKLYEKQAQYVVDGDAPIAEVARQIVECMEKRVEKSPPI